MMYVCVCAGVNDVYMWSVDNSSTSIRVERGWFDDIVVRVNERLLLILSGVALVGTWLRRRVPGVLVWRVGS